MKIVCNSFSWGHLKAHLALSIKVKQDVRFLLHCRLFALWYFFLNEGKENEKKRRGRGRWLQSSALFEGLGFYVFKLAENRKMKESGGGLLMCSRVFEVEGISHHFTASAKNPHPAPWIERVDTHTHTQAPVPPAWPPLCSRVVIVSDVERWRLGVWGCQLGDVWICNVLMLGPQKTGDRGTEAVLHSHTLTQTHTH